MNEFIKSISIRWSDLDPNFHLRHSVYYDFGSQVRLDFLNEVGITLSVLEKQGYGPILFREECVFRREIRYGDDISINIKVKSLRKDHSRFSIQHEFIRNDGTVCAVLTVDGAWFDTAARKLTIPTQETIDALNKFPKTTDFSWTE